MAGGTRKSERKKPSRAVASVVPTIHLKLVKQPQPTYALSDDFSLFRQAQNELYPVLKILKRIGQLVGES